MDTQRKYDEGLSKRELALIKWEETLAKKNKKKKVSSNYQKICWVELYVMLNPLC